jgi:hypothetical protein
VFLGCKSMPTNPITSIGIVGSTLFEPGPCMGVYPQVFSWIIIKRIVLGWSRTMLIFFGYASHYPSPVQLELWAKLFCLGLQVGSYTYNGSLETWVGPFYTQQPP